MSAYGVNRSGSSSAAADRPFALRHGPTAGTSTLDPLELLSRVR